MAAAKRLRVVLAAWLLAAVCVPAVAQLRSLTILHTNDLHAHLLPDDRGRGGFAQIAAILRRETQNCSSCLILNGGDLVQGTPVSTIYLGLPIFELANLLRFDASVIGNHEFDYGWEKIAEFVEAAQFPNIAANIVDEQGRRLAEHAYVILPVNGIRVAIIGALTAELPNLVTADLQGPWRVQPVVQAVRETARAVEADADLIAVLGHLTEEEEDALLRDVPEVSVIISGHSHAGLDAPKEVDGRVLVRVRAYGEEIGRLDLQIDLAKKTVARSSWKKIPVVRGSVPPAEDVFRAVAVWEDKVSELVDVPIATARRAYASREELRPILELALAEESGADLAFVNLGGIRDALPAGTVLVRHIWNIMPFDNKVVIGTFRGRDLPAAVTSRYAVEPEREYTLATFDFVAANQRAELGVTGLRFPMETGRLAREVFIDWFKKQRVIE
jgi:2',3'-cyclic-nucleotide 2'-phosphodiesterase (5'-nucleotidase family)